MRLPVGRLRDMPIWSKLGLIMIVPTIATIVVGTAGLLTDIGAANDADRTRTMAGLSAQAASLIHTLQHERAGAALVLSNGDSSARATFDRLAQATDEAIRTYRSARATPLQDLPASISAHLERIDAELVNTPALRQQINGAPAIPLTAATTRYDKILADLLGVRDGAAEISSGSLGVDMRTVAALSRIKEDLSQERVIVLTALAQGTFNEPLRLEYEKSLLGQELAKETFDNIATQAQARLFTRTVTGPDLSAVSLLEGRLRELTVDRIPANFITAQEWDSSISGKANLIRKAEDELDRQILANVTIDRDALQRRVLIETGVLIGMLLLSILFAWMVARSMARSLRELRHGALTVAQYGLPQAVARLRDPALVNNATPQQLAQQIADPLPVRSTDEFGQVAEAFNMVHLEAVRTAAEQSALRSSVSTMFVNLARRSQILVDRLIGHLDRLERGEEDPDRLAELFQLDHLATRMRRNDENLLVLAGADSSRLQREPAPLMDVLRAAQSEVEHYTRIEFGMIDRDIEIAAHAVNDMVHLVAELLDNATAFSPPDTPVVVEARRVGDRAVLLVEDRGIGMSPEQLSDLNERMANPPAVDVAVSRMMGLVVVARLATRHGVKVELRLARERGTVADMTLPAGVLVPRALAGRAAGATGAQREVGAATGQQPRISSGPLALESTQADRLSTSGGYPALSLGAFNPSPPGLGGSPGGPNGAGLGGPGGRTGGFSTVGPGLGGPGQGPRPGTNGNSQPSSLANLMPPATPLPLTKGPGGGPNGPSTMVPPAAVPPPAVPPAALPPAVPPGAAAPPALPPMAGPAAAPPALPTRFPAPQQQPHSGPQQNLPTRFPAAPPPPVTPLPTRFPASSPGGQQPPTNSLPGRPGPDPRNPEDPTGFGQQPTAFGAPPTRGDLPSWSDLTGATEIHSPRGGAGLDTPQRSTTGPGFEPLPQRRHPEGPALPGSRPGESPYGDLSMEPAYGEPSDSIPRQRMQAAAPEVDATLTQPAVRPPAWPPAPNEVPAGSTGANLATERTGQSAPVKLGWESASVANPVANRPVVDPNLPIVDETMELPIYREAESAWFRTRAPAPPGRGPVGRPTAGSPPVSASTGLADLSRRSGSSPLSSPAQPATAAPTPDSTPEPDRFEFEEAVPAAAQQVTAPSENTGTVGERSAVAERPGSWQTAADDGWRAAAALATEQDFTTTESGLPKRVPMTQLVPGGVERAAPATQKRSPEAVRGLLSAYHRGVQRGRTQQNESDSDSKTPEPTTAGPHNSQGGKEH